MKTHTFFSPIAPAVSVLGAVVLLAACAPLAGEGGAAGTETVEIALPAFPQDLPPLAGWLLVSESGGKTLERFLPGDARSVTLELPRNGVCPVLAYPLTETSSGRVSFFLPAGCVYPVATGADWAGGFEASIALRLLTSAQDDGSAGMRGRVSLFNWKRFHGLAALVNNPWNMDDEKILSQITARSFSIYSVREQSSAQVELQDAPGVLYRAFVPAGALAEGDAYPYCAAGENRVFDGERVFLVCPPQAAGSTGQRAYSLALMPLGMYIY
ncbi:MAG: hypothetical protein LBR23_00290 [Spirochaetaceae bacterium]|jgi:hypothetical protein|nr:hypothetical protein [Spirochaetaceae bacterium]